MAVDVVAILSPGDMGHAVGRTLGANGLDVITCLEGRSERTRRLARQASIRVVGSLEDVVAQADLVLSIVVPAQAVEVARKIALALCATEAKTTFADCNAISPQTAEIMDDIITRADGRFIDASIIGGPPGVGAPPRLYASGEHAGMLAELNDKGFDVCVLGGDTGRASGIKMCYAALTKGTAALYTAVLTTAELLGLSAELRTEFAGSQTQAYQRMESQIAALPANASRWVGEMEEIASTFDHVGVTPNMHQGAADVFRLLSETPFALETPETIDKLRTAADTISVVARSVSYSAQGVSPG